jgi:hypothetical protein
VADKKTETEAAQQGAGQGGQKINKMEAMRRVLAKLGDDAPTQAIQSDLKESFGIDMTVKNIATYRSDIIKKRQQQKKANKPAARKPEPAKVGPAPRQEPPVQQPAGNGPVTVRLEDVLALRSLVDRVGAENVRTLLAALER